MEPQTWLLVGMLLIFSMVAFFYFSPSFAPKILVTAAGPFPLGSSQTIISEQQAMPYYSDSNGSFSAFVYLNPMNRTGSYAACGINPN